MISRRNILLGGLAATLFGPVKTMAQVAGLEGFGPIRSHAYGASKLDVHLAEVKQTPIPTVIYVHGGAWRFGSRQRVDKMPDFFRTLGCHMVSMDYRMLPDAPVALQKAEIAQAISWVRQNITRYKGDPDRLIVMGHSAGCHLATLAVLDGSAGPVKGLICNDTLAYNIASLAQTYGGKLPRLYRGAFGTGAQWPQLSPLFQIGKAPISPVLVAWSGNAQRQSMAAEFIDALQVKGTNAQSFDGAAYSHRSILKQIGEEADMADENSISQAIAAFVTAYA